MYDEKDFYYILDARVLKNGMIIRSCLDMDDVMYIEDDNNDSTDEERWFTGKITTVGRSGLGWEVIVERHDQDGENWVIILNKDNMNYFMIRAKEWDD